MFVFLSYYLQGVLHYSALKAGIAFLPVRGRGHRRRGEPPPPSSPGSVPGIPMAAGLLVGAAGLGLADPDRGGHLVLDPRVRAQSS